MRPVKTARRAHQVIIALRANVSRVEAIKSVLRIQPLGPLLFALRAPAKLLTVTLEVQIVSVVKIEHATRTWCVSINAVLPPLTVSRGAKTASVSLTSAVITASGVMTLGSANPYSIVQLGL